MAITQVISTLPTAPDPSTMTRDQFSTAAAASVLAQKAMVPELNTWAGQVNAIVSGAAGDIASGINGATAKATPVDADLLGITDSAASFVLKKLTWANLKATLGSTFAALAGSASQTFSVAAGTGSQAVNKTQADAAYAALAGSASQTFSASTLSVGPGSTLITLNSGAAPALNVLGSPSGTYLSFQRNDEAGFGARIGAGNSLYAPGAARSLGLDGFSEVSLGIAGTRVATLTSTGLAVTGALSCTGALSKGSGSFRIDHPLKPETHQLVHSFIEGPQADLIYRGVVTLIAGKASVNIDSAAGMTAGTFEALCREVQCFTSNESDWTHVRGKVAGNTLTIEAQDTNSTATVSWMVIGERKDQHMYDTDWTDENGKVIVEPVKAVT